VHCPHTNSASYSSCNSTGSNSSNNNNSSSSNSNSNSNSSSSNINSSSSPRRAVVGLIVTLGPADSSPSSLDRQIYLPLRPSSTSVNSRPGYSNRLNNNHNSVKPPHSQELVQLATTLVSRVLRVAHALHLTQYTRHLHHAARISSSNNYNSNRNRSSSRRRAWTSSVR
jgi:hypothetical protein